MWIGWISIAAWLAPGLAPAQTPPSTTATISGVVLNDATGAPLRHAAVTLSTLDNTPPLEALTFSESNGAFGFSAIPPGKYRLNVSLDGFEHASFGASNPDRPPGTLKLAAGDVRFGITFRLRPLGSISGVVVDPDGDPVAHAQIHLMKAGWSRQQPTFQNRAFASTDERGQYRFAEVAAGEYIIMATHPYGAALLVQPDSAAGQNVPQKMFAPQFYPDAARLAEAAPVRVAPGKDLEGIDFHLAAHVAAELHGKVPLPGEVPAGSGVMIAVYPRDIPDGNQQIRVQSAGPPDFEFEINNLIPGSYLIETSISLGGRDYRAVERVELKEGGQEITLHMEPAIDLAGRVEVEGGAQKGDPLRVWLVPGGFPPGRQRIDAEVKPDGSFIVHNVVPGIWDIGAGPVPRGGFVKAMRLGEQDVLTEDMTIDSSTKEALHIVISARGGVVTGTVTVPPGVNRSARSRVLLAPFGKYAHVLSFYHETNADESGNFEMKGVTPGRYKLYAFEEMDPNAWHDPNFLKPFEQASEAFDVAEGGRVERQTQLILAGTQPAEHE